MDRPASCGSRRPGTRPLGGARYQPDLPLLLVVPGSPGRWCPRPIRHRRRSSTIPGPCGRLRRCGSRSSRAARAPSLARRRAGPRVGDRLPSTAVPARCSGVRAATPTCARTAGRPFRPAPHVAPNWCDSPRTCASAGSRQAAGPGLAALRAVGSRRAVRSARAPHGVRSARARPCAPRRHTRLPTGRSLGAPARRSAGPRLPGAPSRAIRPRGRIRRRPPRLRSSLRSSRCPRGCRSARTRHRAGACAPRSRCRSRPGPSPWRELRGWRRRRPAIPHRSLAPVRPRSVCSDVPTRRRRCAPLVRTGRDSPQRRAS